MTHWSERHKLVAAVYIIFERNGKLLLQRRANTGYMDGSYSLPAGHIDENESAIQAGVREVKEETELELSPRDFEFMHCMVYRAIEGTHDRVSLFFRVTNFTKEPQICEPDKCDELKWVGYDELPEKMVWEVRHALEEIRNSRVYSEVNYEV